MIDVSSLLLSVFGVAISPSSSTSVCSKVCSSSGSSRENEVTLLDEHGRTQPQKAFYPTSLSRSEPQERHVSYGTDCPYPRARTRRAALDVLTLLRELEENARVHLSGDTYDAGSDHSSRGRVASPTELSDVQRDASFAASRGADLPYVQV
jgi:hypothetical protein